MSTIRLDWESPEEAEWRRRLTQCGRSSAFQSWSWGAATAAVGDAAVRRAYIEKNGRPVGLMQIFEERRLGIFTLGRLIRGPLFHRPVMPEDRVAALVAAAATYPLSKLKRFSFLPELPDGPAARGLLSDAGFQAVMAGYETAWLDLRQDMTALRAGLRQNFRNQLVKAESHSLLVRERDDPRPLLQHYDRQRKRVGYSAPSGGMLSALPDQDLLCLDVAADDEILAGILFVLHGRSATYQVGWTTPAGRDVHAHNLLLWRGLAALAARGIHHLDVGGMERRTAPGVAHFKDGMGGEPYLLPATYV